MKRTPSISAVASLVIVLGSGCGSGADPSAQSPAADKPSPVTSAPSSVAVPPERGTVIRVGIAGGAVTPTNAEAEAVAGQPIVLEVSSDAPDSIHVHSVPEHVFEIQPRPDQRFEFTVDIPGQVDVELHELNRTVVTITVRP